MQKIEGEQNIAEEIAEDQSKAAEFFEEPRRKAGKGQKADERRSGRQRESRNHAGDGPGGGAASLTAEIGGGEDQQTDHGIGRGYAVKGQPFHA